MTKNDNIEDNYKQKAIFYYNFLGFVALKKTFFNFVGIINTVL